VSTTDQAAPRAEVGDVVVVTGHRVGEGERSGTILEVMCDPGHQHFRVRWEDGRETVFYPGSDATIKRSAPARPRREVHHR